MYTPNYYQKEAYLYSDFFSDQKGKTKMYILPSIMQYVRIYDPKKNDPYTMTREMAKVFMEQSKKPKKVPDLEDMAQIDIMSAEDRVSLILEDINQRSRLTCQNLDSLYSDLFRIYNWRNWRHWPESAATDKTWMELNKLELDIRDKIRRELKDSAKDTAFAGKDLRESLLDHRNKSLESIALDSEGHDSSGTYEDDNY